MCVCVCVCTGVYVCVRVSVSITSSKCLAKWVVRLLLICSTESRKFRVSANFSIFLMLPCSTKMKTVKISIQNKALGNHGQMWASLKYKTDQTRPDQVKEFRD